MTDLNSLVDPDKAWTLQQAIGINNGQQIVARGTSFWSPSEQHAVSFHPSSPATPTLTAKWTSTT